MPTLPVEDKSAMTEKVILNPEASTGTRWRAGETGWRRELLKIVGI